MIIDIGLKVGSVVTLKLTSGEELVARFDDETSTHYKLSRPMVIGMGQQGPGLMPYLFTVHPDKVVPLLKSTVTVAVATDSDFANQYLQSTTGIKLV